MIKEAYVSFEVAKLLKEKGFNEQCSSTYDIAVSGGKPIFYKYDVLQFFPDGMKNSDDKYGMVISAPTHQMAIAWLREEYGISIEISALNQYQWVYAIYRLFKDSVAEVWNNGTYVSYEDATDDALKYCLENLDKFI